MAAAIVFLNGWTGSLAYSMIVREGADATAGSDSADEASCENLLREADLDRVPPGLVLGGINSGGVILARTSHSVLAASNHRAVESNRIAYRIFLSPTQDTRAMLVRNKIDYVLSCHDQERRRLAAIAPNSFAADLDSGHLPAWLTPLPTGAGEGLAFFAVVGTDQP